MSSGYRDEVAAALAQAEALQQENAQLQAQLAAAQQQLAVERQGYAQQLQAAYGARGGAPSRSGGALMLPLVLGIVLLFMGMGAAVFLMKGPAPAPESPVPNYPPARVG